MGISMGSSEGAGVSVVSVLSKKTVKKQRCFPWFSHFSCDLMSESNIKSQPRLRAKTLNHTHNTHNQDKVGYPVFRSFGRLTVFLFAEDTPMPMAIWWAGSASCATAALTSTPRLQLIHGPRAPTGASLTCVLEALVEHWLFSIGSYWFIGLLLIHDELLMSCLMFKSCELVVTWLHLHNVEQCRYLGQRGTTKLAAKGGVEVPANYKYPHTDMCTIKHENHAQCLWHIVTHGW